MNPNLTISKPDRRPIAEKNPPRARLPSAVLWPHLAAHLVWMRLPKGAGKVLEAIRFRDQHMTASRQEEALIAANALLVDGDLMAQADTLSDALENVATRVEIGSITAAMCDSIPTFDPIKTPGYLDALLFVLETENETKPFSAQALAGGVYKLLRSERFAPTPDTVLEAIREEQRQYRESKSLTEYILAELSKFRAEVAEKGPVSAIAGGQP